VEPEAHPNVQAVASEQPRAPAPSAVLVCGAEPCATVRHAPPLDVCMRELDALLASLGEA
jgi:hypothetical protein